ncbi:MAG: thiamine phosphate synthase [Brevinema sp.]
MTPYPHYHKLMLITHRESMPLDHYLRFIKICLEAGITSLQLREKESSYSFQKEFGIQLLELCRRFHVPLIVNDNPKLAADIKAAGVHLGQSDSSPTEARALLGADTIIGWSIETMDQLETANNLDELTYVTASAVFPTPTKTGEKQTFWELDGVRQLAEKSRHTLTAIGGIDLENADDVMKAGAEGLAIIGAIHHAENPAEAVRTLRRIIG